MNKRDRRGGAGGRAFQYVRGNYKPLKGTNLTVAAYQVYTLTLETDIFSYIPSNTTSTLQKKNMFTTLYRTACDRSLTRSGGKGLKESRLLPQLFRIIIKDKVWKYREIWFGPRVHPVLLRGGKYQKCCPKLLYFRPYPQPEP